jgi:hypothetical protein
MNEVLPQLSPIELYLFTQQDFSTGGNLASWGFTSSNSLVSFNGVNYIPETIKRGETQMIQDMNKSVLVINTIKNNAVAQLYIAGTPVFPIFVQVYRVFLDSTGAVPAGQSASIFQGRITNCSFSGFEVTINCEPIFTHLQKSGLRRIYEPSCSHNLYDPFTCKVDKISKGLVIANGNFSFSSTLPTGVVLDPGTSSSNQYIIITDTAFNSYTLAQSDSGIVQTAAYFTGGMVRLGDGSFYWIADHISGCLALSTSVPKATKDATATTSITLYPGCDHTLTVCINRFQNQINFGGFPFMIPSNPFSGTFVPQG